MEVILDSKQNAFTLIEILVVIAIISILAALLSPALRTAKIKAMRNTAIAEVASIKTGLLAYLSDHNTPPTFAEEDTAIPIDHAISQVLLGSNDSENNNRSKTQYVEFKKISPDNYHPVNPWDESYYFKFDMDYDNKINAATGGGPPNNQPKNDLSLDVIVWTYKKKLAKADDNDLIASWK